MRETRMLIKDVVHEIEADESISPAAKARMRDVLLAVASDDDDIVDLYRGRRAAIAALCSDEFPEAEGALRDVFCIPAVTELLPLVTSEDEETETEEDPDPEPEADEEDEDDDDYTPSGSEDDDQLIIDAIHDSAATTRAWIFASMAVQAFVVLGAMVAVIGAIRRAC